ncbi:SDR family NAD(P)-dependent oxidoreductase [Bacillus sp. CB62A.1]
MKGIDEAVVVVRKESDEQSLVAFVISNDTIQPSSDKTIQQAMGKYLPNYMIPSKIYFLEKLPKTLNAKLNRKELTSEEIPDILKRYGSQVEDMHEEEKELGTKSVQLTTNAELANYTELFIKEQISHIRNIPLEKIKNNISIGDYGFNSISFTNLSLKINEYYGLKTNPSLFYTYSTIQEFTNYLVNKYANQIKEKHPIKPKREGSGKLMKKRAIVELEDIREEKIIQHSNHDIAIIGMSGVLPGSKDLVTFWNNILAEKDLITTIPSDRWDWSKYDNDIEGKTNTSLSKWGAFVPEIDKFDAPFFGISRREAELMDPQQRIMLESVWKAIEDAGYKPSDFSASNMGVFIGATGSDYAEILMRETDVDAHTISGIVNAIIPNRISYFFNFQGPSELIDTACSSSLVSVARAVDAIRNGDCKTAIAGGVNLIVSPFAHIALSKTNMLSEDGRCKTFDKSANGYVRGEGGVVILLKSLEDAIADKDSIYAVIKGTAVNHGGKTNSLTAPSAQAQEKLIISAVNDAGVNPQTIRYIEAHGTGTALGDPIEINGLQSAFQKMDLKRHNNSKLKAYCGIGSVKTNIGHLEAVAGLAGLVKSVFSLKNKKIPSSIHCKEINPFIDLNNSQFYLVNETKNLDRLIDEGGEEIPLRAGVSSFGFGGTNAHIVLEEYTEQLIDKEEERETMFTPIIIISAKDMIGLKKQAVNILQYIEETDKQHYNQRVLLEKIVYTLQVGREPMQERLAFIAYSIDDLKEKLNKYVIEKERVTDIYTNLGLNNKETIESILGEEEINEIIKRYVQKGEWGKLCKLWVSGVEIDWMDLYSNYNPGRISLPTYPFNKERYWIPVRVNEPLYGKDLVRNPPLLGEVSLTKSLDKGLVFEKVLSKKDLIVRDHVVNSQCIFPGTGYLETAIESFAFLRKASEYRVKNVTWFQPLIIEDTESATLQLSLQEENDSYHFQIESKKGLEKRIHSKGVVTSSPNSELSSEEYMEIEDVKNRCSDHISRDEFYNKLNENGISYGPYFQGIEEIWRNDREALGKFKLSNSFANEVNDYYVHPVIMDCALQTMGSLIEKNAGREQIKLPFSVEEVHVLKPLRSQEYFAYVVNVDENTHNIALLNDEGKVCVKFYNLVSREIKSEDRNHVYRTKWIEKPRVGEQQYPIATDTKNILYIYPEESRLFKDSLKKTIGASHTIEIQLSKETKQVANTYWEVAIDDVNAYRKILKENHINQIYFLGGISSKPISIEELQTLEEKKEHGVMALLYIFKVLQEMKEKIKIVTITNHIFEIFSNESVIPIHAGISGFMKTASLECPHIPMLLVDTEYNEDMSLGAAERLVKDIIYEVSNHETGEIAIRDGKSYIRKNFQLKLPELNLNDSTFRSKGVYLIAGAGGIGIQLASYLAEKVKARLILVGRSEIDSIKEKALSQIRLTGAEVDYIQADITNQLQMDQVVSNIKKKYGALHGVFHSAMVLRDIRIQNMTKDMFDEVLHPKVKGSIALFNAVKEESLDFMMLFSSTNSFIGNEGQSNYNTACSYQDAIASFLKRQASFPIKIINWSFWGSIGAVANDVYKKQLNTKGLLPIEVKEGMELIEKAVVSSTSQIIMFKARKSILDELNFDDNHYIEYYSEKIPSLVKDIHVENTLENLKKEAINLALKGFKEIEEFGITLLLNYFWKNGVFTKGGEKHEQSTLLKNFKIIPAYKKLFITLLNILEKEGLLTREHPFIYTTHLVEKKYNDSKINMLYQVKLELEEKFPVLVPYIHLLWECVSNYPDILIGRVDHKEVMFPRGEKNLVGKIYQGNVIIDYYNQVMGKAIRNYIQERLDTSLSTHINILEIGAGTGGTSEFVLSDIQDFADNVTYCYTDISPSFTKYGEEKYSNAYPFTTFKKLDIEKDFEVQGFLPNDFDIVLATNVLHATNDIQFTLQNIKRLLKTNGIVLINEITNFQNFSTLTFGLTEGWWRFSDAYRIEGSPLLTIETWKRLLDETGFFFGAVNGLKDENGTINQSVILAESDGEILSKNKKESLQNTEILKNPVEESTRRVEMVSKRKMKMIEEKELSNSDLLQETKKYLKKQLEIALKINSNQIKDDENFDQIGVDSLIIIELNKSIEKSFGKIASTLFFEYKTVEALAQYFVKEHKDKVMQLFAKRNNSSQTNLSSNDLFEINTKIVPTVLENQTDKIDNYKREQQVQKNKESNFQETVKPKDIAIIGVSGRYPSAENIDEYWDNLKQGKNCISEVPSNRWDWRKYYDSSNTEQAKGYSKWGGFLKDIDKFDAEFFNIDESYACEMDPQERLLLETAWSLLEDAGYPDKKLSEKGEKVGVFVGAMYSAYGQIATRAWEQGIRTNAQSAFWIIPNRISHFFNFNGPSISIDTACSSSLTAIHYASKSLNSGECSVAIAGGVNLILHPRQHVRLAHLNNLAKSDKNRSFSEDADGFVEGEGVGAVLLKPLDKAIQDNDYIYGVIKGTSVNSSGESSSFTIPSISALENVVGNSIKEAGVHPETINYMEAHATGTVLGDPLEISALSKVFAKHTNQKQYCTIGSVKSNVGHLEAASGIAALTKILLQLKYKKIVPSINISKLNSFIDFENSPFYVQEDLVDWKKTIHDKDTGEKNNLRRAGISSFGAGGSNAHIIVEEYPQQYALCEENVKHLFVFSAKKAESLLQYAKLFCNYIKGIQNTAYEPSLAQIAYTLQTGRAELDNRLAFTASNFDELINKLIMFINKKESISAVYYGKALDKNNLCLDTADLELLAKGWVEGKGVSWELLYQEEQSRIPLPTYCFDRKSYWINENTNDSLVDGYVETYSYNEPYVKDHVSFGKQTLLGMTYLSLAFEAFQRTHKDNQVCFRNLLFHEPVEINVGEKIIVDTRFKEEDKLYVTSSFREINSENLKRVAHGEVIVDNQIKIYTTNIPSFNNHMIIKGEKLYNCKPGVYGPALRTLKEVFVSEEEAWGKVVLTEEMKQDSHQYLIHPAILDGAIMCRIALESCVESDMFIPLMIKEACIYKHLPDYCYCRVRKSKKNSDIWEGDIEIFDEDGTILVLLKGVVCKKVRLENPLIKISQEKENEEQGNNYSEGDANNILSEIENYLVDKISLVLNKPRNGIDKKQSFMQMGIDSKTLISLSTEIKDTFGIELYPTIFFEYQNINDLANYFLNEHSGSFVELTSINYDESSHIKLDKDYSEVMPKANMQSATLPSHVKKEEYSEQDEPIAIIGLSGIMPQSDNLNEFWDYLEAGENLVTEVPKDRWDWKEHYKGSSKDTTKTNVIWGGFMNAVDKFDPAFFKISPREACLMDPQHRLTLQLVWKAIEEAGYNPRSLSGSKTGLFMGVAGHDYSDVLAEGVVNSGAQALTGNAHNLLTGRVSYLLNLHGPSEPIDTACSSSLVAIHRAVESLRSGECELALAGGINVLASPTLYVSFDQVGLLSPDGKCKAFDRGADGTVRGEGAGVILLKPLSKAIRDKDHIHAIIRGNAVNHGGHASALTAPNPKAQSEVIKEAYEKANIDPTTVTYIEAHGTGTALGDPVEINGLKSAFRSLYEKWGIEDKQKHCGISTVKANMGHLETAAGIAGIIKILLSMKHQKLTGLVNFKELNPYIQLDGSPFYLVEKTQPWKRQKDAHGQEIPYRAGVSSFGFSGVNAHIVIEEYRETKVVEEQNTPELIVLSAHTEERLKVYAQELSSFLKQDTSKEHGDNEVILIEERVLNEVVDILSGIFNIEESQIEKNTSLTDFGIDQVMWIQFVNEINERYGLECKVSHFICDSCLSDIAKILSTYPEVIKHYELGEKQSAFENRQEKNFSLQEVSYTLQVGREAMEERLAFIATSIEEVISKLEHFIAGKEENSDVYKGNIRRREVSDSVNESKDLGKTLTQRDLKTLADLWISGENISAWEKLYEKIPYRVTLPTYPFEEKKYWIERRNEVKEIAAPMRVHALTSLIDSNESKLGEQRYKKLLRKNAFYLQDHIVNGQVILPGVVYLEMARMAGTLASSYQEVIGLQNIVWTQPIHLSGDTKDVSIVLHSKEERVIYNIYTEESTVCSQGDIIYGTLKDVEIEWVDINKIQRDFYQKIDRQNLYPLFEKAGFTYGESFKPINNIYFNEKEALAEIQIPKEIQTSAKDFLLHPSLLEGALQTAGYLVNTAMKTTSTYLPFGLGKLEIYGDLPEKCYAYASVSKADTNVLKMNVSILDEFGQVLVKITDYTVRSILDKKKNKEIYYRPIWKKNEEMIEKDSVKSPTILFDKDEELFYELQSKGDNNVLLIKPGNTFKQLGNNIYEINPLEESDYKKLFQYLKNKSVNYSNIVHLWSFGLDDRTVTEQLQYSLYSLFYTSRTLLENKIKGIVNVLYFYPLNNPLFEAMNGFHKSIHLEKPSIQCKTIGISSQEAVLPQVILNELSYKKLEDEVRYVKGRREIKVLQKFSPQPVGNFEIKQRGVYVITGGLGGIGFIVAQFLAKEYQARLVLTGRSKDDNTINSKLQELQSLGGEVVYLSSDISNENEVKEVIECAKDYFANINGVIHCAGIIRDSLALHKTKQDIEEVIASKVYGTMYIDEATKNENLDFMVFFSSISGEKGNVGQCDYAFANSFLDNYSRQREQMRRLGKRSGKTLSINWPLWRKGGITVNEQIQRFMENTLHIVPLEVEQGINIFKKCVNTPEEQIMVLYGNEEKLNKVFSQYNETSLKGESVVLEVNKKGILTRITQDLVRMVSDISGIQVRDILTDVDLDEYGFDSITLTELSNDLNQMLDIYVTPAVFFELSEITIKSLGKHLYEKYSNEFDSHYRIDDIGPKRVAGQEILTNSKTQSSIKIEGISNDTIIDSTRNLRTVKNSFPNQQSRDTIYEPIAIVGIGGVMPQSEDLEVFWNHLVEGRDLITEVPLQRWDWHKYYGNPLEEQNKTQCITGGFMKDIDTFDASFFKVSPKEAKLMDPQQRIFLEAAWKTIEDAGYKPSNLAGSKTGVFVGVTNIEYTDVIAEASIPIEGHSATSNAHFLIPNRTSYFFDFRGPSEAVDTACSSSGVAIHRAITSLQAGECEMALVGGVNALFSPRSAIAFDKAGMLSKEGKCKTFDKNSDGFVRGEGIGTLLLKPLSKAIADKDQIHAVIKGSAVNHSGKSKSFTAPNPNGQIEVIKSALHKSKICPSTINYVEVHGTATALGDTVELEALKSVFKDVKTNSEFTCGLGSVKTNIGHLEAASGMASILKVVLAMKNKTLPPSIHFEEANPFIHLEESPFYIVKEKQEWNQFIDEDGEKIPRRAGVNIFGAGGVNAHIIIEDYENEITESDYSHGEPLIFVFSAKNNESMQMQVAETAEFIRNNPSIILRDVAYTLQIAREELEERIVIIAKDLDEFLMKCDLVVNKQEGLIENQIYQKNVRQGNRELLELVSDEITGNQYLELVLKNKQYNVIAKLWVNGVGIEWERLYENEQRSRVSLPTYNFAKTRYWVSKNFKESPKSMRETKELSMDFLDDEKFIKRYFIKKISSLLEFKQNTIKTNVDFQDLGFDSIMAAKFKYEIENEISSTLPMAVIGEANNLDVLVEKILKMSELRSVKEGILKMKDSLMNPSSIREVSASIDETLNIEKEVIKDFLYNKLELIVEKKIGKTEDKDRINYLEFNSFIIQELKHYINKDINIDIPMEVFEENRNISLLTNEISGDLKLSFVKEAILLKAQTKYLNEDTSLNNNTELSSFSEADLDRLFVSLQEKIK